MDFLSILSIFVLAVFVGYYVVWSGTPARHTPLMAVTNGVGSGIILVMGSDLAPTDARNEFLASYRLLTDAAVAGTPLLLSGLTALVTLGPALAIFGWGGFAAAWLLWRYIPRYSPKPNRIRKR